MRTHSAVVRYSHLPFCQLSGNGLESLFSQPWLAVYLQKSTLTRIAAQEKNKDHSLLRSLSVLSALCLRPLLINSKIIALRELSLLSKIQLRLFWNYFPIVLLRMLLRDTKLWLCQHSTVFPLSDMLLGLSTTRLPFRDAQPPKNNLPCFLELHRHRYLTAIPSHDSLKKTLPCFTSATHRHDHHKEPWPTVNALQCVSPQQHSAVPTSACHTVYS